MTTTGVELLRLLGAGVRPDGATPAAPAGPVEGLEFGALLKKAESGAIQSGRRVEIPRSLGVELTVRQISNLSRAADGAEAAGAARMLAMVEGRALEVDVATRTVERSIEPGDAALSHVLTGIDAAVLIPSEPALSASDEETTDEDDKDNTERNLAAPHDAPAHRWPALGGLPGVPGGSGAFANRSLAELLASLR